MKRNQHEWTERTDDGRRVYRAWTERGEWVIQSAPEEGGRAGRRRSGEPGSGLKWEDEDPPSLDVLKLFRGVLWNKYQRGRIAYKLIEKVDVMIEDTEEEKPPAEPAGDGDEIALEEPEEGAEGL